MTLDSAGHPSSTCPARRAPRRGTRCTPHRRAGCPPTPKATAGRSARCCGCCRSSSGWGCRPPGCRDRAADSRRSSGLPAVPVLPASPSTFEKVPSLMKRVLLALLRRAEPVHAHVAAPAVQDVRATPAADVVEIPEHADRLDRPGRDAEPAGAAVADEEGRVRRAQAQDLIPVGRELEAEIGRSSFRDRPDVERPFGAGVADLGDVLAASSTKPVLAATGTVRMTFDDSR